MSGLLAAMERPRIGSSNTVFKSGPLFISSKGISWKSWKKRWFILTRTSLVFFKSDPSSLQQRGGEVNLTLGGIDLNNSGRVVVREDKKLLTVLFPDGRDGRAFTLKSESSEDLYDWKTALEQALAQAPSPAAVMGNNGIFLNDPSDSESSLHHWREMRGVNSVVVGRPILLALEDIDGGPSFLEKAFQFLEKYGSRVEGILRQSADVEEVEQRVKDYERGKNEFDSEEDAHIVADCIKHVLRELPSSPVPASCCIALLEAYKIRKKEARINGIRSAIFETFPEPNRHLLHRTMKMMHTVCTYSSENRMTPSAVAACMAPLLLRPLLAGECEFDDDFDVGGDSSYQLRAAANAANSAQAIIATLLDEYENIFNDDSLQRHSISSDSRLLRSISECSTDYGILNGDDGFHDSKIEERESDDEQGRGFSAKSCRSSCAENDHYGFQALDGNRLDSKLYSGSISFGDSEHIKTPIVEFVEKQSSDFGSSCNDMNVTSMSPSHKILQSMGDILFSENAGVIFSPPRVYSSDNSVGKVKKTSQASKRSRFWRRNDARTAPSTESVDSSGEDELAIQRLEVRRNELLQSIANEIQRNEVLHNNLDRRKHDLQERQISLQQDVYGLQNQLKAEKDLKTALEAVINMYSESNSSGLDSKMRADIVDIASAEEDMTLLKQKVSELLHQLNQQQQRQRQGSSNVEHTEQAQNHTYQQKFCQGIVDVDVSTRKNGNDLSDSQLSTSTKCCEEATSRQQLSDGSSVGTKEQCVGAKQNPSTMGTKVKVVRSARRRRPHAPSLNDLTLKLDFFKERKAHLMHQLHNLNLNYGSHDVAKSSPPPPWA